MGRSMIRNGLLVIFTICLITGQGSVKAQLTSGDGNALTGYLNTIAADPGWPQDAVNGANNIFAKPQYGAADWNQFFDGYFSQNRFTDRLENYLGYPTFFWLGETVNQKLQAGLAQPLMNRGVTSSWQQAANSGGGTFSGDLSLTEHLANSAKMLTSIARSPLISSAQRNQMASELTGLYDAYPGILKHSVTHNPATHPFFGTLRAKTDLALLAAAPSSQFDRLVLTSQQKTELANVYGLSGTREAIWHDHSLLYLDNGRSNQTQLDVLQGILHKIPGQLHNTDSITVNSFLGNSNDSQGRVLSIRRNALTGWIMA